MSTQTDALKGELASDDWKVRGRHKRSKKRPFLIEHRWRNTKGAWRPWCKDNAYETAAQRDMALEHKKHAAFRGIQYRARDE